MRSIHFGHMIRGSKFGLAALVVTVALTITGLTVTYAARDATKVAAPVSQVGTQQVLTSDATSTPASATTSPTAISTASAAPALAATPAAASQVVQAQALPSEAIIQGFPSLTQAYSLSCEYAAASAVTLYWGSQVSEDTFVSEVPLNTNPHLGFRGDINGAFGGVADYGVYAEALAPVLEKYGYAARVSYSGVSDLKGSLAGGNPVVVWITAGKYTPRTPVIMSAGGTSFTLVPGEHALVAYGYDSSGVYLMDVASGNYYHTEWQSFLTRWGYFDDMTLVITPQQ